MRLTACLSLALACLPAAAAEFHIANRDSDGLSAAIEAANRQPGIHRIVLAEGGIYTLDAARPGALGLPSLRGRIEIDGRGAEIRRYSDASLTLLEVASSGEATLRNLTLAEGSLGAVRNFGRLMLDRVQVTDNAGEAARAIIVNHGQLRLDGSLIGYNAIHGAGRDAGTVLNFGLLEIVDTRFEANSLSRRYPSLAAAGAVLNHGELRLGGLAVEGNRIIDEWDGLATPAILNLDGGTVEGEAADLVRDERQQVALHADTDQAPL
jgi:hypothetical protein